MKILTLFFSLLALLVFTSCTKKLELPPSDGGFHFKHYERVKVDAKRFPWVGSGIDLKQGDRVLVLASGKVTTCLHCGSRYINQPPTNSLYMLIGDENNPYSNYRGRIAGNGYYYDFKSEFDGELKFAVRDWGKTYPPPRGHYGNNSGSHLLDIFVYDSKQKEEFKRFLSAMLEKNSEDSMFTSQVEIFLK